jgi:hypothetical protein
MEELLTASASDLDGERLVLYYSGFEVVHQISRDWGWVEFLMGHTNLCKVLILASLEGPGKTAGTLSR